MADPEVKPETEKPEVVVPEEQPEGSEKPEVDWEAKAKAHYAQLKEAREKLKEKEEELAKAKPRVEAQPSVLDLRQALQLRNEGYSDQEILVLSDLAESMKKPISEVVKVPLVKAGIEAERSRVKAAQAVPAPSHRTSTIEGKPLSEVIRNPEEFTKNFSKIMEKYRRR